ncbi:MAG TPA: PD-(D/E)XK nuclease family protein [Pyrinomonadaceae bacterium]|nr:PD-(D/E)XK nuclease family protein [Pyrinomonadaceae bacterium]
MPKEIWLGPVLGTNRERLLARCAEYVAKGETDRLLYIAASHPLLDLATQTVLDGKNVHGVWDEFPFYLFRGFVRRVLSSAIVSEPRAVATGSTEGVDSAKCFPDPVATARGSDTLGLASLVPIDREELPLRHSLISQIIKQLAEADRLPAIKRLANRGGCVNTIATLIGELQRAGKTAEEFASIVDSRAADDLVQSPTSKVQSPKSQNDFDQDVALIYSKYEEALKSFGYTDADADQLSALHILRGDQTSEWLDNIDLLVLDGFFDFTPVQGEMLRLIIQRIPNVIVNINYDDRNPQIFQTFQSTIEQLKSIADFEEVAAEPSRADLPARLFNAQDDRGASAGKMPALQLFECSDRETELRSIAKEMKRLIGEENYKLSDMAVVVRERAAYADIILRVFAVESVPCNLERRVAANDIPCIRATAKLLQILKDPEREHVTNPKASDLAHLLKTDYFRLSDEQLLELTTVFDDRYATLLDASDQDERNASRRFALGIGRWAPDVIENVIAYVGSEQRVRAWLDRAARLIRVLPSPDAARSFIGATDPNGEDAAVTLEVEAPAPDEPAPKEKTKRPSPIHPAAIAWTMLVIEHLRDTIALTPEQGTTDELRRALMSLLEAFEFAPEVQGPLTRLHSPADVPQVMLNVRGIEALRRALAATVRSFDVANTIVAEIRPLGRVPYEISTLRSEISKPSLTVGFPTQVSLSAFIDELERCLKSQTLAISAGDRDGLRVLEATDVRGLRFRALFIAGMNEGSFPLRASRDWLYPHDERERLKKHGLVLEDISTETLLKEEHYFYQCACRATERLYLTRPLAADDGIETVPSYYIEELRRAIAPAQLERRQIRSDIDSHEVQSISSGAELAAKLVRQKAGHGQRTRTDSHESEFSPVVATELAARARREMYLSDSLLRRVAIEIERSGDGFGPYDGQITNSDLRALLANHFGPEYVYSASGLSAYGNCAFKFFGARVLRLEPRNEAALDLTAIDAGKLLHDVLRRFFEKHRKQYLPSLDREVLRAEINAVADEVFKEHEQLVPPLNERIWKIDCEIRKLILEQVLLHDLRLQERTQARGMLPTYFELAFGRPSQASDPSSKSDYLKIPRPGDGSSEAASIQGQIDRVDVSESCGSVVAYDYKSSVGAKHRDMSAGRQLQIPIYLAALEQLFLPSFELAGGGYYRLRGRGQRLNEGLYRKMLSDCTNVTSRIAMVDDIEWQRIRSEVSRRVWQFIDGMRAGDFRVRPSEGKKTCKFCDHSAICRYDAYRINRKRN